MAWPPKKRKSSDPGVVHGYRSGLELSVAADLEAAYGTPIPYESVTIKYTPPLKTRKYTPDFQLPNGVIIETKGRFLTEDRQKHLHIKAEHPDLDIRFVFTNPHSKITKTSKMTYAMWCEKHGFLYAAKKVPVEWLAIH